MPVFKKNIKYSLKSCLPVVGLIGTVQGTMVSSGYQRKSARF